MIIHNLDMSGIRILTVVQVPVSCVNMILKELVLSEGGGADCALVGEVSRLQRLVVIFGHVIQQFPLVHLCTKS